MQFNKKIIRPAIFAMAIAMTISFAGAGTANAQGVLKEILDRMDGNYKTLKTFRSNVTLEKINDQTGTKDRSEGTTAYISKNGNAKKKMYVRIDWAKPLEENMVVIDKEYKLYRPRLGQAIVGTTSEGKGSAGGALSFISMSKAELQANFTVQYKGQEGITGAVQTWHVFMLPKTRTSYRSADLWVDSDGMPRKATITELNGDTTTVVLTDIKKNPDLTAAEFVLKWPEGTKIVKS